MDLRKTFDQIPQDFDLYRPRYTEELFSYLIKECKINENSRILEIGPGTGQATEPFLRTGAKYLAIELGENFTELMKRKFSKYPNFKIINGDFETTQFEGQFDFIFSAAAIQWIEEKIAFSKCFRLLKNGGYLTMFMTLSDEKSLNSPSLTENIEKAYELYFKVDTKYNQRMNYRNAINYGFSSFSYQEFKTRRVLNSEQYVNYISTHYEHISLKEPSRSLFFNAVKDAIKKENDKIIIEDTLPIYLLKK